jgi:hypothetical protein
LAVAGVPWSSPSAAQPLVAAPGAVAITLEDAVRRVAWGGDRRRGVARIELGGEYEGTAIVVRGEGREVALRVELPSGAALRGLPERLVERLEARGLRVVELEVG